MSNQSIADVTLEIDDNIEVQAKDDSSPSQQEIAQEPEIVEPVVTDITSSEDDVGEQSASPVEESHKKPGDMIPRARLNEEILKKKKHAEELQREREQRETLQRENDELRKTNVSAPSAIASPQLYDDGIDGDEDKLRIAQAKAMSDEVARQIAQSENTRNVEAQKQRSQEKSKAFNDSLKSYVDEHPEYGDDSKEAGDPAWPNHVNEAVVLSEVGPALDHYLLKNKDERERILAMPPARALMAIGVIENSISNPQPEKKAQPRLTKAPAPIETSSGGVAGKPVAILDGYTIE